MTNDGCCRCRRERGVHRTRRWARAAPGLTPPHAGEGDGGGRWRAPRCSRGGSRGDGHLGAARRREGSGEQSGRTRPAALARPRRRCCSARPSSIASPSEASPRGGGLLTPPLRVLLPEALWCLQELPKAQGMALPQGFKVRSPPATALEERRPVVSLLLLGRWWQCRCPRDLSLSARPV